MKKITLNEELNRIQEMMGVWHVSPSGKRTNMSPEDDDYEINYGKNAIEEISPSDIVGSMREEETDENIEVLNKFKVILESQQCLLFLLKSALLKLVNIR